MQMMKTSLQFILSGVALALVSCTSPSSLHVTDVHGDPIPGVRIKPVAITYDCPDWNATNQCGNACIRPGGPVQLEHDDYRTVCVDTGEVGTQHVVMSAKCNGR